MYINHLSLIIFFLAACGPQWVQDPNASVVVTCQVDGGDEQIVLQKNCKSQAACEGKTGAECAIALYRDALSLIKEAETLEDKKMFLSARVEYMLALSRLIEAEIRLKEAKVTNYKDWKVAVIFGLEKKVQKKIKLCRRKNFLLEWKR
tara:strand:- start:1174 stop:1617 length:444 start_codon:yes stop_codon:yes gene_type:complete